MDASPHVSARALDSAVDAAPPRREGSRTITVIATYRLSEEGRKLSLLTGGDGRASREVTISVPTSRFHLVSVDLEGTPA